MQVIADFNVQCKAEMEEKIDAAVAAARNNATAARTCGALVTRNDFDHFTVALSPSVPFGLIHEQDQVRRI